MDAQKRNQTINVPENQKFKHNLSHTHVSTLDYFRLQPLMCTEVIPDSDYSFDLRTMISSAPLGTQVYGGCHLDVHAFFVPSRLVYENWNNYYAGDSRTTSFDETLPYVTAAELAIYMGNPAGLNPNNGDTYKELRRVFGSLGYPTFASANANSQSVRYNIMQARVYQKIWWDYYRDSINYPESSASSYLDKAGGQMTLSPFVVRYRTFKKDYISTLLASPQLGGESVAYGGFGYNLSQQSIKSARPLYYTSSTAGYGPGVYAGAAESAAVSSTMQVAPQTSASMLRGALAMQRYLERLNVTGTRPMERLLSLLGAKPSAERLDMAEFLGGKTIRVNVDGLVNSGSNQQVITSNANDDSVVNAWGIANGEGTNGDFYGQGYQTGHASGSGQTDKLHYHPTEHGYIMVIASLIPEYHNCNVVDRQFIRGLSTPNSDRFDFFHTDFDGLGYQEALLSEVATPSQFDIAQVPDSTWLNNFNPYNVVGYEPKYEDYRRVADRISGDFQEFQSATAMRYLAFTLSFPEIYTVSEVKAGQKLTTSSFAFRAMFDKHFQIADPGLDHFVVYCSIVNDAVMPLSGNQLPTELSDMANSNLNEISYGGVRL